MATNIPIENTPGAAPLTDETLAWTAADIVNDNEFTHTGRELLLVRNEDVSPHNVTFQSVAINGREDPLDNTAIPIPAGEYHLFGPFKEGWRQTTGVVLVAGDDTNIEFLVIRTPQ